MEFMRQCLHISSKLAALTPDFLELTPNWCVVLGASSRCLLDFERKHSEFLANIVVQFPGYVTEPSFLG